MQRYKTADARQSVDKYPGGALIKFIRAPRDICRLAKSVFSFRPALAEKNAPASPEKIALSSLATPPANTEGTVYNYAG